MCKLKMRRLVLRPRKVRQHIGVRIPDVPNYLLSLSLDILDLIVVQVAEEGSQALFRLLLVSSVFYPTCLRYLYRHIKIDFSSLSSRVRLLRISDKDVTAYVRTVVLRNCAEASLSQWQLLDDALSRIARLTRLSWDNHAQIPDFVFGSIVSCHPRTALQARVDYMYRSTGIKSYPSHYTLLSPQILAQITQFELSADSNLVFYNYFKNDLLELLGGTINLRRLRLYRGPIDNAGLVRFPERPIQVRSIRLPHLVSFHLQTQATIFTNKELGLLNSEGGWPELRQLSLSRATQLIPFLSRVPKLVFLHLTTDRGEGMDVLALRLNGYREYPLGQLKTLAYSHSLIRTSIGQSKPDTVPWCVFTKVKGTITTYKSFHLPASRFCPGYETPTANDVQRLLQMCLSIMHLTLDLYLEIWNDVTTILGRLAQLPYLKTLTLYVHRPRQLVNESRSTNENSIDPLADARKVLGYISEARPESYPSMEVHFKEVRDWADMCDNWNVPDLTFRVEKKEVILPAESEKKKMMS